jgi:large subunit ribosomal protein L3
VTGFIGKKLGMTQVFGPDGELVPVTVVEATPCTVVQLRTRDTDGYDAIQIGFGTKRERLVNKPLKAHMTKAGRANFSGLLEFDVEDVSAYQIGQELKVGDVFKAGDKIDVWGITKGKGYQGVVRRYGFKGQTATRGTHESFRGPGSVGNRSFPGRIFRGKRMDGHMGSARRTIQNLEIVEVRADEGLVFVRGGLPGAAGERVVLNRAVKKAIETPGQKPKKAPK